MLTISCEKIIDVKSYVLNVQELITPSQAKWDSITYARSTQIEPLQWLKLCVSADAKEYTGRSLIFI